MDGRESTACCIRSILNRELSLGRGTELGTANTGQSWLLSTTGCCPWWSWHYSHDAEHLSSASKDVTVLPIKDIKVKILAWNHSQGYQFLVVTSSLSQPIGLQALSGMAGRCAGLNTLDSRGYTGMTEAQSCVACVCV